MRQLGSWGVVDLLGEFPGLPFGRWIVPEQRGVSTSLGKFVLPEVDLHIAHKVIIPGLVTVRKDIRVQFPSLLNPGHDLLQHWHARLWSGFPIAGGLPAHAAGSVQR